MINWNIVKCIFESYIHLEGTKHNLINERLKYLTEVAHVNYRMDSVSDTIMKYINEVNIDDILLNEYQTTTWYFDSYTLTCYNKLNTVINKDKMHHILFKFINSKNFLLKGYSYIEDRTAVLTKNDDIKIVINLYDYFYYSKSSNYEDKNDKEDALESIKDIIQGSIDHELLHGFDEYLLPEKNWLDNLLNSFSVDVRNDIKKFNNILTSVDIQWIKDMSYLLGKDELRAHFKATSRFIEKDIYRTKNARIFKSLKELESVFINNSINYEIDVDFYILGILRTHLVQELSRMILFKEYVNEFIDDVIRTSNYYSIRPLKLTLSTEKDISNIRAILLGYYMYKHNLLSFKTSKPLNVSHFFSEENINIIFDDSLSYVDIINNIRNIENVDDYINCVKSSVFINYVHYETLICNECERLLKIFSDKNSFDLFKDYKRSSEVPKHLWPLIIEQFKGIRY